MRNLTLVILIVVCVLGASGQSTRRKKNDAPVKQVVSIADRTSSSTKASAFTAATANNVTLRNELAWTFGGKEQRGWYLYDLLINKTLDSEHDTSTNEFAATLAS